MHRLLRTIEERSGELIHELTDEVGMSESEATHFLREAAPAVLASYVWRSGRPAPGSWKPGTPDADTTESGPEARDVLEAVDGRSLAPRVGLSPARTWDGLRALVPAVLRAAGEGSPDSP